MALQQLTLVPFAKACADAVDQLQLRCTAGAVCAGQAGRLGVPQPRLAQRASERLAAPRPNVAALRLQRGPHWLPGAAHGLPGQRAASRSRHRCAIAPSIRSGRRQASARSNSARRRHRQRAWRAAAIRAPPSARFTALGVDAPALAQGAQRRLLGTTASPAPSRPWHRQAKRSGNGAAGDRRAPAARRARRAASAAHPGVELGRQARQRAALAQHLDHAAGRRLA